MRLGSLTQSPKMNDMTDSAYIHGSSPDEQARLELMNGILNERCLAELALAGGERVLEMGAGTGVFSEDLLRVLGSDGSLVAIERDERQVRAARERLGARADLRQGDVNEPPLEGSEWGSFDLVHARFLLEHLPNPQRAVDVMVRAARPGGRIALVDDDHSLMRFAPDPGGMAELWRDYAERYRDLGCDPEVGRRLVTLLVDAGAEPMRTTQIPYGGCRGEAVFDALVRNLAEVVDTGRESLLAHTEWTAERMGEAMDEFRAWAERPDAVVWYALPMAIAKRPR